MNLFHQYQKLSIPEKNGKKIGLFRTLCAIFGGLAIAYLGMSLSVFLIPGSAGESITLPLMFNTFVWALTALWIALSHTKRDALLKAVIPPLISAILLCILFFGSSNG